MLTEPNTKDAFCPGPAVVSTGAIIATVVRNSQMRPRPSLRTLRGRRTTAGMCRSATVGLVSRGVAERTDTVINSPRAARARAGSRKGAVELQVQQLAGCPRGLVLAGQPRRPDHHPMTTKHGECARAVSARTQSWTTRGGWSQSMMPISGVRRGSTSQAPGRLGTPLDSASSCAQ